MNGIRAPSEKAPFPLPPPWFDNQRIVACALPSGQTSVPAQPPASPFLKTPGTLQGTAKVAQREDPGDARTNPRDVVPGRRRAARLGRGRGGADPAGEL